MIHVPVGEHKEVDATDPQFVEAVSKQFRVTARVDQCDLPETAHQHRIALADVAGRDLPVPRSGKTQPKLISRGDPSRRDKHESQGDRGDTSRGTTPSEERNHQQQ